MAATKGWAIVTGASAGIGAEFVRALVGRGHPVLAVARRRDRLEALAKELDGRGRVEPMAQDLAAPGAAEAVVARAAELGEVELLVNNAGLGRMGRFAELDLDGALGEIRLNVEALVALTRLVLPSLVARRAGGVINVASTAGFQAVPWMANYGATKAFVISFTEAVATELRGSGVRVMAICPGPTDSEFAAVGGSAATMKKNAPVVASAASVVRAALAGYDGGRVLKVQGFLNWLSTVLSKLSPRALVRLVTERLFRPV